MEHELEFQKRKNAEMLELHEEQSVAAALTISNIVASKENFHFIVDVSSIEYGDLKVEAENTAAKYVIYYINIIDIKKLNLYLTFYFRLSTAKKQHKVLTLKSKIDIKTG